MFLGFGFGLLSCRERALHLKGRPGARDNFTAKNTLKTIKCEEYAMMAKVSY